MTLDNAVWLHLPVVCAVLERWKDILCALLVETGLLVLLAVVLMPAGV